MVYYIWGVYDEVCPGLSLSWLRVHLIFGWRQAVAKGTTKRKLLERAAETGTAAPPGAAAVRAAAIPVQTATWVSERWASPA